MIALFLFTIIAASFGGLFAGLLLAAFVSRELAKATKAPWSADLKVAEPFNFSGDEHFPFRKSHPVVQRFDTAATTMPFSVSVGWIDEKGMYHSPPNATGRG